MTDRSLQSEARRLEVITFIAFLVILLGLIARYIVLPVLGELRSLAPDTPAFWNGIGALLIDALPAFALAGAIDACRKLFKRLAEGALFGDAVGRGVRGIGSALIWAALATAVVAPWLQAWVDGKYGFGGVRLDPTTVLLAVLGGAMLLLGRLLKRAGAMQSELERFV
ncbi:MAG: DUF2975 domain-containing protein [Caulobacteraceae bacterium]|nr:DUF2975 domain-containing protein [Caulobacteraceae bacterium]